MSRTSRLAAIAIGLMLPVLASQAVPIRVTNGLVGEWNMTPASFIIYKQVIDTSGYGRHGRIYGGDAASYGWMGTASNMAGNKYAQVPNSSNLNFGNGSFTLAAWVRFTSFTNGVWPSKAIISNIGSDRRGYGLGVTHFGSVGTALMLHLNDVPGNNEVWSYKSDFTSRLTLNRWHHIAVSVNRTAWPVGVKFYIDGYDAGYSGAPVMGNVDNTDRPFYIGAWDPIHNVYNFNDIIDEVFVYNRALPNWEIWSVLNPGQTVFTPAYWNDAGTRQSNNNCYNYANNKATNTFAQPGRASIGTASSMSCAALRVAAIADGLEPVTDYPDWPLDFKKGLALVVAPGFDYHWYRLDSNSAWSHKPGQTAATNRDNSGNAITDPRTANRGPYTDFCGFFIAWTDIAEGYGHENIK